MLRASSDEAGGGCGCDARTIHALDIMLSSHKMVHSFIYGVDADS